MLADNVFYLKKNFPILYEIFSEPVNANQNEAFILEDTKNNLKTVKIRKNGNMSYLHSKYDPIREANSIIDLFEEKENIEENVHVLFYGLGLGYHIDEFVRRFPKVSFSLYEPSKEVFSIFLDCKSLKDMNDKNLVTLQCEYNDNAMVGFFSELLNKTDKKMIILDLPVYQNAFADDYSKFLNCFMDLIKNKRSMINTNLAFQKRWILNSVKNLKTVLNTPNILMHEEISFAKKTAILVSAGPSLDFEIENLRMIKEKGLAFIFCVGSAINALIYHNIYPDAICTYDPTDQNNLLVFKKINEKKIDNIPLIYGSSVGFEVLESYIGPQYHMITNQDIVADYFLKAKNNKELERVHDASSIAVVTLELLKRLDFSSIILVGQNLAYMEEKNYAQGIDYTQSDAFELQNKVIKVKDVLGNEVSTIDSFNTMRYQIEQYIKTLNISVINTTSGGAHIEGTKFLPLESVIENILLEKIVQGHEFDLNNIDCFYDPEFLQNRLQTMSEEYGCFKSVLGEIKRQIPKIKELINNSNKKQTAIMYDKLDRLLDKLEANDFFKTVAMPMNRVQYQLLINSSIRLKNEKSELKKFKQMVTEIDSFIDILFLDENINQNIMEILDTTTKDYLKKTKEIKSEK